MLPKHSKYASSLKSKFGTTAGLAARGRADLVREGEARDDVHRSRLLVLDAELLRYGLDLCGDGAISGAASRLCSEFKSI